jgi:hypothetical protein
LARSLDSELIARLREVVAGGSATESELRELTRDAERWTAALEKQARVRERRLAALTADPGSSVGAIATELRSVETLRPRLDEARRLLAQLDERARELRTAWLRAAARKS